VAAATARRQALEGQAAELLPRYAQAAADAGVMPVSAAAHKLLIATAGVAIGVTLFSVIPNASPQAQLIQPQIRAAAPQAISPLISAPASSPEKQPVVAAPTPPPVPAPVLQEPVRIPATYAQAEHVQTRQAVNIRSAPDKTSQVVRIVQQGTVMTVYARRDGWVQVGDGTPWG
jgi:uncharacterized protein YgiM (DUF1202 family)